MLRAAAGDLHQLGAGAGAGNGQGRGQGNWRGQNGPGASPASQGREGYRRAGGSPDFQQMLSRMPSVAISDLQKGDAVMVVATEGSAASAPTAITLISGVEPILTAAPSGAAAATILSPWNLGASPGGEGSRRVKFLQRRTVEKFSAYFFIGGSNCAGGRTSAYCDIEWQSCRSNWRCNSAGDCDRHRIRRQAKHRHNRSRAEGSKFLRSRPAPTALPPPLRGSRLFRSRASNWLRDKNKL